MENFLNRTVDVEIDGRLFKMLYTTKASAESGKYVEILSKAQEEDAAIPMEDILNASAGLVSCLCNGWTYYKNLKSAEKEDYITPEEVLITTTPDELKALVNKAAEAISTGSKTYVQSADAKKN